MDQQPESSVEERLGRLETRVSDLQRALKQLVDSLAARGAVPAPTAVRRPEVALARARVSPAVAQPPVPRPKVDRPARPLPPPKKPWYADRGSQYWLNKIGIGLVLFGVVFFFKYAVDQGWLNPPVRVALGLILGIVLFVIGLRTHLDRPWFSRVMIGGAIATFYITGFAAFQLYDLVSYPVAFGFMVLVTILAFHSAMWQDEAVLSVIGVVGALVTPFLLLDPGPTVAGLALYTSIVLAGTSAVFMYKGWRSLLWTSAVGGWSVLLFALVGVTASSTLLDKLALQAGVVVAWLVFWAVPVMREGLVARHPERWTWPSLPTAWEDSAQMKTALEWHVHVLTLVVPLLALAFSAGIWPWPLFKAEWGWVAILGAGIYVGMCFRLYRWEAGDRLAYTHAVSATVLLTVGAGLLLRGAPLLIAWTAEMMALHLIARRLSDRVARAGGHLLFAVAWTWLWVRLFMFGPGDFPMLNATALTDLAVIVLMLVSASTLPQGDARSGIFGRSTATGETPDADVYRFSAYAAVATLLWRELDGGVLLLAWTVQAVALHLVARRWADRTVAVAGHVLFFMVAAFLGVRVVGGQSSGMVVFNVQAVTDLVVIGAGLAAASVFEKRDEAQAYRVIAHVAALAWLWRELSALPNGSGFVTISWGVYGIVLLVLALMRHLSLARKVAMATLLLVVGKLFLVDLARVEALWRVMLFTGFGGLFLALSYYFRDLWQAGGEKEPPGVRSQGSGDDSATSEDSVTPST